MKPEKQQLGEKGDIAIPIGSAEPRIRKRWRFLFQLHCPCRSRLSGTRDTSTTTACKSQGPLGEQGHTAGVQTVLAASLRQPDTPAVHTVGTY
eukprot:scaffold52909_cov19-Tisochrysis_lutea.AAC.1